MINKQEEKGRRRRSEEVNVLFSRPTSQRRETIPKSDTDPSRAEGLSRIVGTVSTLSGGRKNTL